MQKEKKKKRLHFEIFDNNFLGSDIIPGNWKRIHPFYNEIILLFFLKQI